MITYHGDPAVKEKYLARIRAHRDADNIIQGIGWENGKGCAVGCTLEKYDHDAYESELGIPRWLAHVEDRLFELMSNKDAKEFPVKFLEACFEKPVDLEQIKIPFLIFVVECAKENFAHNRFSRCLKAIDGVIDALSTGVNLQQARADAYAAYTAAATYDAAAAVYAATYGALKKNVKRVADKLIDLIKEAK